MVYGVEFEEEQQQSSVLYTHIKGKKEEPPRLVRKVMDWGIAKTPKQANRILIAFSITSIGVSIIFFIIAGSIPQPIDGDIPPGMTVPA